MANRVSISDAPLVELGREGVDQNVPVAEKAAGAEATPGRTTIAAMRDFFGGGGSGFQPQVQQIYLDPERDYTFQGTTALPPGGSSLGLNLGLMKRAQSLIRGDLDFYQFGSFGGSDTLLVGNVGFYRLHFAFWLDYSNTGQIASWRWQGRLRLPNNPDANELHGEYLRPFANAQNVLYQHCFETITIFMDSVGRNIVIDPNLWNVGSAITPVGNQETIALVPDLEGSNGESKIVIEFLGGPTS